MNTQERKERHLPRKPDRALRNIVRRESILRGATIFPGSRHRSTNPVSLGCGAVSAGIPTVGLSEHHSAKQFGSKCRVRPLPGKGLTKGPGKGKGKGMDKEPKSTSHAQPAQPSLSSQPSKRPSRPSKPVPNKRKIWGTPRVCTASSVKKAITQLAGVEVSKVEVKRKYKKDGEKLVKWWHVVRADEGILDKLEQEWSKVNVQTSWQLVPCLIFSDNAQASNPSNQDTQAFVENKAPNTGGSNAVDNDVVENNTAAASSNNGVQSTVNQSHASPAAHQPPLYPEQISFSSFLEQ